ncbi:MAG TPA: hypothetical protein VFI24_10120 [Pyrinomonadaceae bacterium]|nr:hypothetical protein [Pyrinomonadaceae bacterium]
MQTENGKSMTQEQLIEGLHLLGYGDASVTRIATWRKLGLLPPFTRTGEGRGRGAGRQKGYWSEPGQVLKQAEAIMGLLKSYKRLEELYLPLWQLGYPIPLALVRSALLRPLLTATEDLAVPKGECKGIEDVIDDAVWDISLIMHGKFPFLDVPDDTMSAALNVVTNPHCNFADLEYGVTRLKEWEHSFAERCEKILNDEVAITPDIVGANNNIFRNAPFINQYLSLPHLVTAVQSCADEDLMQVQQDLQVGREILQLLKQVHELLSFYLPESWRALPEELPLILNFGTLAIWADLALRNQGFGPSLDQMLPSILEALRQNFNETLAKEIAAAGPEIGMALLTVEELMYQVISKT